VDLSLALYVVVFSNSLVLFLCVNLTSNCTAAACLSALFVFVCLCRVIVGVGGVQAGK
jgi:hypothetical protein